MNELTRNAVYWLERQRQKNPNVTEADIPPALLETRARDYSMLPEYVREWAVAAIWLFTFGACMWSFIVLILVYG